MRRILELPMLGRRGRLDQCCVLGKGRREGSNVLQPESKLNFDIVKRQAQAAVGLSFSLVRTKCGEVPQQYGSYTI